MGGSQARLAILRPAWKICRVYIYIYIEPTWSLHDFNFWEISGLSIGPTKVKLFAEGSTATKDTCTYIVCMLCISWLLLVRSLSLNL